MIVSLDLIKKEIENGNIKEQSHPTKEYLSIYKYTPKCVYSKAWNNVTKSCRGLVVDKRTGFVVINSMPKFFNHDEEESKQLLESSLKERRYKVTDKMDGSLIQATFFEGELIVTSSGSFTSPQVLKAKEILNSISTPVSEYIYTGFTYIFEIIYPENRIVVDYKNLTKLTLLAIRSTNEGLEFDLEPFMRDLPQEIDVVKEQPLTIADLLKEVEREDYINKEGFIVRFDNGSRIKFKYKEYVRLHKIVSNLNEKSIWESLKNGIGLNIENVPDELFNFCKETIEKLQNKYSFTIREASALADEAKNLPTRKEQAIYILNKGAKFAHVSFKILDGKDPSQDVWNLIEPEDTSKFGAGEG